MANRYWIGGSGNWSDTANWSTTSGGGGGSAAPTSSDDVYIDENSGFGAGGTITLDGDGNCHDFICTSGHTFTLSSSNDDLFTYGDITLESNITVTSWRFILTGTEAANIDWAGATTDTSLYMDGSGRKSLTANFPHGVQFYRTGGVFDANGYDVGNPTTGNNFNAWPDPGETYTIYMGEGTWYVGTVAYFTDEWYGGVVNIYCETSTIETKASYCEFYGGGNTFHNFVWGTSTDDLYFEDSFTLHDFTENTTDNWHSLWVRSGETITFTGDITFLGDGAENQTTIYPSAGDIDGNSDSISTYTNLYSGSVTAVGQSFTIGADDVGVYSIGLNLRKTGSPTGTVYLKIYAHSGTFGTSSIPTGATLATASTLDVSTVTSFGNNKYFYFTGEQAITLSSGTNYVFVVEYSGGDASNYLMVSKNTSGTHEGNLSTYNGSWNASAGDDIASFSVTAKFQYTLSKSSGIINAEYLDIEYSNATGGAIWCAGDNSTDSGNNTGWRFYSKKTLMKRRSSNFINLI